MFDELFQLFKIVLPLLFGLGFVVFWLWFFGRMVYLFFKSIFLAAKAVSTLASRIPDTSATAFNFLRQYPSVIGIIAVNLIPFAGVVWYDWKPFSVIFIYWLQTGIIGFFSLLKIKKVTDFSPPEHKIRVMAFAVRPSGRARPVAEIIRDFVGVYAFGMFTSLLFLVFFTWFDSIDAFSFRSLLGSPLAFVAAIQESFGVILLGTMTFFLNHGYSYIFNFVGKKEFLRSDLPAQLSDPIDRVGMIWGSLFITGTTLVFIPYLTTVVAVLVVFKTMFDVYAHLKEHGRYFYWQYEGQIQAQGRKDSQNLQSPTSRKSVGVEGGGVLH